MGHPRLLLARHRMISGSCHQTRMAVCLVSMPMVPLHQMCASCSDRVSVIAWHMHNWKHKKSCFSTPQQSEAQTIMLLPASVTDLLLGCPTQPELYPPDIRCMTNLRWPWLGPCPSTTPTIKLHELVYSILSRLCNSPPTLASHCLASPAAAMTS
jgi:hypothetical protein